MNAYEIEIRHSAGVYIKQPITIVRGEGALLYDTEGQAYLDCTSGHGVANLGHAHPKVAAAIAEQAGRLITLFETYPNEQRAALMLRLTSLTPGLERVFLCNSGAEAVEASLKFARLSTGRTRILAAKRAFHGRTFGALSATFAQRYRQGFEPLVPGFEHISYNNISALEEAINDQTAALILEIVQGEGGIYPATPDYLEAARSLCDRHGALLIFDEIQSGFGRTGKMFAYQHYGIQPDMITCAKSVAGGVPMGAVLLGPRVQNLAPGVHGSTFGGNPLACAAALAAIQAIEEEDLPRQAAEKGAYLIEHLRRLSSPVLREVRGLGLMIGLELKRKVAPYLRLLQQRRILALNAGMNVLRLLPPLVITYEQLDTLVAVLDEVLAQDLEETDV
ncbi:MAG: aspartate aminotransferase family protein [Anaerolineales bacterium]|nr:aspartate aminotransferase family protein [Anaerolineales bacterium]